MHHGAVVWEETTWEGQPAILATLVFDDPRTTITLTIYKNSDPALPAGHMAEIHFSEPIEPVVTKLLPRLIVKAFEQDRGRSLAGNAVAVTEDLFWIALSDDEGDMARNTELLRSSAWIDVPIWFSGGATALLTFEKGVSGDRVVDMVTAKWAASR